jgi:hypothetical protein
MRLRSEEACWSEIENPDSSGTHEDFRRNRKDLKGKIVIKNLITLICGIYSIKE